MAFTRKKIEVTIELAGDTGTNQPASFAESSSSTVTLSDHRTSVRIQNSGSLNGSKAQVRIWGLTLSLMDQLSTLGIVFNLVPKNKILITAGDEGGGLATVFAGIVQYAYADFNQAPDVPFIIDANAGLADSTVPTPASSFTGATDVAKIMSGFAAAMNIGFENNGVDVTLANPYYAGNIQQQVQACARDANINADRVVGGPSGEVLAIWPKGGNRKTPNVPLIAAPPAGTMIGYPSYTQQGIMIRNIFDPQIARGTLVEVRSSLKRATGQWAITKLDHALDALLPKGEWMSTMYCYNPKFEKPIPPQTG